MRLINIEQTDRMLNLDRYLKHLPIKEYISINNFAEDNGCNEKKEFQQTCYKRIQVPYLSVFVTDSVNIYVFKSKQASSEQELAHLNSTPDPKNP